MVAGAISTHSRLRLLESGQCFLLHCQVGLHAAVRGVRALVPKPQCNIAERDAGCRRCMAVVCRMMCGEMRLFARLRCSVVARATARSRRCSTLDRVIGLPLRFGSRIASPRGEPLARNQCRISRTVVFHSGIERSGDGSSMQRRKAVVGAGADRHSAMPSHAIGLGSRAQPLRACPFRCLTTISNET